MKGLCMNKKLSSLMVVLGGACWGMVSLFVNPLSDMGFSSMEISLVRMLIATPVFVIIALIKDKSLLKIKLKDLWLFALLGLFEGLLFNVFYFYTITHSEASIAVMLLYTSPIFVMVESYFIFKEKMNLTKLISLILTVIGCVLVAGFIGSGHAIPPLVLTTGILTGLTYGSFTVVSRLVANKYNPLTVTSVSFIIGCIFMFPFGNIAHSIKLISTTPNSIFYIVGLGVTCSVIANSLFTIGIKGTDPGVASILAASEPLMATIVGIFVFHDSTNTLKIIGIIFILIAIILQSSYFDGINHLIKKKK